MRAVWHGMWRKRQDGRTEDVLSGERERSEKPLSGRESSPGIEVFYFVGRSLC